MTDPLHDRFTEGELLAAVPRLTTVRLAAYVETQIIVPLRSGSGLLFRRIDIARIELLCDLSDQFDLDEDAQAVVLSLIDQLHAARRDLATVARAIAAEPPEVRARIGSVLARQPEV